MVTISIKTQAYVDQKRRIMIDLPDDVEPGMVELDVVVRQMNSSAEQYEPGSIEWAREKLRAAGLLAEDHYPDALEVSEDELRRLGQVFADERPMSDLIDEDREERF
jgi:hypothetical protein